MNFRLMRSIYFVISSIVVLFVFFRPMNHDETYYLISAKALLFEGKMPYSDFIFHQMPLMLAVYLPVTAFGNWALILGRLLSAALLLLSFYLFVKTFRSRFSQVQLLLFTFFFWFNFFLIDWAVIVKVYSLSILLISAGIYFYSRFLNEPLKWKYLMFASIMFSMLIFAKITFAAGFIVFVLFTIFFITIKKIKVNYFYTAFSIFVPTAFFALIFLILTNVSLDVLYFNLFGVNIIGKDMTPFSEDFPVYLSSFLIPQNFIILLFALFSLKNIEKLKLFLLLMVLSFFLFHIPTRLLSEYNTTILPLLMILAVFGLSDFSDMAIRLKKKFNPQKFAVVLLIIYCLLAPFSIYHIKQYLVSSKLPLNPVELNDFTTKLDSVKGNTVVASWEGLSAFSSKETMYKENYAIPFISDSIDDLTKKKYGLILHDDYKILIEGSVPDIVIFDETNATNIYGLENEINAKYKREFEYKYIKVFVRK